MAAISVCGTVASKNGRNAARRGEGGGRTAIEHFGIHNRPMCILTVLATGLAIVGTALAQLPPEIMVDRHLVRAEPLLAGEDFGAALAEMDAIVALQEKHDLQLPDEFDLKYAEVAFVAGRTEAAIDSPNDYLLAAGRSGEFYRQALELLDKAELATAAAEVAAEAAAEAARRRPGESRVFDGMEFVWVPAGEFRMGSTSAEAEPDEQPVTQVRISRGFWLGKYEVTQSEWQAVMGTNPSEFSGCGRCPVDNISWDDVQDLIRRLNARAGEAHYRLPTEAEWEYAARAGTSGDRYAEDLDAIAWYDEGFDSRSHPVGQMEPNGWGLYDMLGNVIEWVQDWYGRYQGGTVADPQGSGFGSDRVIRGGSWWYPATGSRASYRAKISPSDAGSLVGFRLLRMGE